MKHHVTHPARPHSSVHPHPHLHGLRLQPDPRVQELMPGDVGFGHRGDQFKTLLGSCVSVILTDPARTVGAMCHIVHSSVPNSVNRHNTAYGSCAMDEMFHRLRRSGLSPTQCDAYVYGGGNMFPGLVTGDSVGDRNVRWVLDFLQAHRVNIVATGVGGMRYRKLAWTVGTGQPELVETQVDRGE